MFTIPEYNYIVTVDFPHLRNRQHYEFHSLMSALQAIRIIKSGERSDITRVYLKYEKKERDLPAWAEDLLTDLQS